MKTLLDLITEYLDHLRSLNYSKETLRKIKSELNIFNRWLKQTFDIQTIESLMTDHLKRWQKHLATYHTKQGYPLKARSINFKIIKLRGFLKHLAKDGYVRSDLTDAISYVKEPTYLPGSTLTHAQAKRLLSATPTDTPLGLRNRAILELLYSTGIRSGEILGLDVDDVDFKNRTAIVTGKGSKQRVVPIGKTAMRYLENYVKAIRPYFVANRPIKALFVSKLGNRLEYTSFKAMVKSAARRINLDINVTPHTFRRSCTTELIRGGANLYHVKELLGHESLDTLRPYTKLTIIDLKKTHRKCHPREKEGD